MMSGIQAVFVACKSVSVQKLLHFTVGSPSQNEHLSKSASNCKILGMFHLEKSNMVFPF